ncbi:MAG TPA: DinB family protein [Vicinamibacterales bacterium]|nr:DinB family protein [Vicinamibacterales bacterium]
MTHDLEQTIALLSRTPKVLDALLRDMPDAWTRTNEGDGTWSPAAVVAHLNHTERNNWITRARVILESGEARVFDPLDGVGGTKELERQPLPQMLDAFARLRADSVRQLRALELQPADLDRRGRHPKFGVVTLSQLLATWAAHDLTHLHQISRVMAYQSREDVGPWVKYLGVLHCTGHGEK